MVRHCTKAAAPPSDTPFSEVVFRLPVAACALALALALLAAAPCAAWAASDAADGTAPPEDGSQPTEPYGKILRITEDGRLFASLFLPGLPGHPELDTLYVERAWADDANAWSLVYTFAWFPYWGMYSALEDEFQSIYFGGIYGDVPIVDYFEMQTSYRSFYLRARALSTVNGAPVETAFAPVLFTVPEDAKPGEDAGGGSADEGGGGSGDKGGIGQGENDRPVIEAPSLAPLSDDSAHASGTSASENGVAASPGSDGAEESASLSADPVDPGVRAEGAPAPSKAPSDSRPSGESMSTEAPSAEQTPPRAPGAVVALVATAALAGIAALALRSKARRH